MIKYRKINNKILRKNQPHWKYVRLSYAMYKSVDKQDPAYFLPVYIYKDARMS